MRTQYLGYERRELIEASFRISFELPAGADNPFLCRFESTTDLDMEGHDFQLRVTRVEAIDGFELSAFSVINGNQSGRNWGGSGKL
ncbi:hypothetical protein ACQU0X_21070 [Pseudovibrio ascidiaceicola]|uniref:hypothetical protein n=1 Tax=Pseudovibrio ascidiaceicola TaxID=285279 RepID=UPI003D366F56